MSFLTQSRRFPSSYSTSSENYAEIAGSILHPCMEGDIETLKTLLQKGADPEERDRRGRTGLHWAAIRGQEESMDTLIAFGADVTSLDNHGNTPLHYCGHVETIHSLLENGADNMARNYQTQTPTDLMRRRGIDPNALQIMEDLEDEDEAIPLEDQGRPLMRQAQRRSSFRYNIKDMSRLRSVWYEFCYDLGAERLVLVLILILCVSLYLAYMVTGMAKHRDTRIPVDGLRSVEL